MMPGMDKLPFAPPDDPLTAARVTHLEARGAFNRFPHPEVGTRQHIGAPWRMSRPSSSRAGDSPPPMVIEGGDGSSPIGFDIATTGNSDYAQYNTHFSCGGDWGIFRHGL